jgi:hypothetical protein
LTYAERRNLALILLAVFIALILLTACGTTHHTALPAYEPPLAKTNFQHYARLRTPIPRLTIGSTATAMLSVANYTRQARRFIELKL